MTMGSCDLSEGKKGRKLANKETERSGIGTQRRHFSHDSNMQEKSGVFLLLCVCGSVIDLDDRHEKNLKKRRKSFR
jgi:hypothetical protein